MTTKTEIIKWLKGELISIVKPYGYKIGTFHPTGTLAIFKEISLGWNCVALIIDSDSVSFATSIRVNQIEETLFKITGIHRYTFCETLFIQIYDRFYYKPITKQEEFANNLESLKLQFPLIVEKFDYYAQPKHILELWDSLEKKTKKVSFKLRLSIAMFS
jgi:hypothetical protein